MPSVSDQIVATCEADYDANKGDCNQFLKAVANDYFDTTGFDGLDADGIIGVLANAANGWANLNNDPQQAIADAKGGKFVVAGMTSAQLADPHGHLAVVVGQDGQLSGTVIVPMCYAGSIGPNAVRDQRVSETFPATAARTGLVGYYSKTPDKTPNPIN